MKLWDKFYQSNLFDYVFLVSFALIEFYWVIALIKLFINFDLKEIVWKNTNIKTEATNHLF